MACGQPFGLGTRPEPNQVDTRDRDAAVPSRMTVLSALVMVRSKYGRPADSNLLLPETSSQISSLARPSRSRSQTIAKSRRLRSREGISSRQRSSATWACRDRAWSVETPAVAAGMTRSVSSPRGPLRPARTTEKTPPADSAGPHRTRKACKACGGSAVSGVLVVERPGQAHDAGQVLHVIAAEARVEARKHGSQTRSFVRGMQVLLKQPVPVDSRPAAHDDRRLRNTGVRPSRPRFVNGDVVDVAPDAANRLDAAIVGIAALWAWADSEVDVGPRAFGECRQISMHRDHVGALQPLRGSHDAASLSCLATASSR